jgi:RNA polymerase sigma factor for flagellar operon FliA
MSDTASASEEPLRATLTPDEQRLFDEARFVVDVHAAHLAARYRHVSREELRQEGFVALLSVLPRYDPTLGARFSTYCYPRVFGAMVDYAQREAQASRASLATSQLLADEEPGPETVDFQEPREHALAVLRGRITSFILRTALAPEPDPDPEALLVAKTRLETVQRLLPQLDDEERTFLQHFYVDGENLETTGARMGIHKRTATRIHQRIKKRLTPLLVQERA